MCGHVGIAGDLEFKDEATLKRLLLFDYFRGTDSTGLAAIRKDGAAAIAKMASHPIDLFDTKSFGSVLSSTTSKAFIGHNRAATKGKVSGVNAHPYEYGHIVGAHNGTLTAASWLELEDGLGYKTDVDSMAIFAHMEKFGVEKTVAILQGAWALVWFDLKEDTLNFLRNKERSFYYATTKDLKKVLWASEWPMIQASVEMSTSPYELHYDKDDYCFWATDVDVLYTFEMSELLAGSQSVLEPRVGEMKGKEPAPVVTYNSGVPFKGGTAYGTTSTTTLGTVPESELPPRLTISVRDNEPFHVFINELEFEHMAMTGCSFCSGPVDFTDVGVVVIERDEQVLCPTCSGKKSTTLYAQPKNYREYLLTGNKKEN